MTNSQQCDCHSGHQWSERFDPATASYLNIQFLNFPEGDLWDLDSILERFPAYKDSKQKGRKGRGSVACAGVVFRAMGEISRTSERTRGKKRTPFACFLRARSCKKLACVACSCLEVVGERENGRARARETREGWGTKKANPARATRAKPGQALSLCVCDVNRWC